MHHHSRKQVKNGDTAHVAGIARPVLALFAIDAHRRNSIRKPRTSVALLLPIFMALASIPPAIAQQTSDPSAEDTDSLPQLSDFTPPYTCPWFFGRPASCNTPIKVAVECVDLRTIDPKWLTRPLTETELANGEKACELLPLWLDQDPRITITNQDEDLKIKYDFSVSGNKFSGLIVFLQKNNFRVRKSFEDRLGTAAYFVEESLLELGERGYLP